MTTWEPKIIDAKEAVYQILRREYKKITDKFINSPTKLSVSVTTSYPLTEKKLDTGDIDPSNIFGGNLAQITISRIASPAEETFISDQIGPASFIGENTNGNIPSLPGQIGSRFLSAQGRAQHDIIEVRVWTLNAQLRDELYKLTQQIMFEQKQQMMEEFDIWHITRISGSDEEVSAKWLPRTLFVATLNYSILYPLIEISSEILIETITASISSMCEIECIETKIDDFTIQS